jgi:hypothetical protein
MEGLARTRKGWPRLAWAAAAALVLIAALIGSRGAQAQSEVSKITLIAPGAPATAWSEVEWLDPTGAWQKVEGWQGTLETLNGATPLKQWTVYPENFGQGPFRWIVYSQMGGAVWGMSETFNLPATNDVNLRVTVEQQAQASPTATGVVTGTQAATTTAVATTTATPAATGTPAATAMPGATGTPGATSTAVTTGTATATGTPGIPVTGAALAGDVLTLSTGCTGDNCDFGVISAYLMDAPAGSSAGVQWLDPSGAWRNVEGWQGAAATNESGLQVQRWTVYPENFGQGPFRWVVTQANGAVWGLGPSFDLPNSGQHLIQFLEREAE